MQVGFDCKRSLFTAQCCVLIVCQKASEGCSFLSTTAVANGGSRAMHSSGGKPSACKWIFQVQIEHVQVVAITCCFVCVGCFFVACLVHASGQWQSRLHCKSSCKNCRCVALA